MPGGIIESNLSCIPLARIIYVVKPVKLTEPEKARWLT